MEGVHGRCPLSHSVFNPRGFRSCLLWCFDGHGGAKVAAYSANNLHRYIVRRPEYSDGDVVQALKEGFFECDRSMKNEESLKDEMAGCTAVVVMTKGKELWCANAGDSRCVAGIKGSAKALSVDHKPMD